jgi:Tfp pilus assembly protein PilO
LNRRGPLIAAVVSGVVVLLAAMLVVLPKMHQVGQARDDLLTAQSEQSSLQTQLQILQDAQASAPVAQKQIEKIGKQIPTTADLPGLFRLLRGAADLSAVDFFSFSPGIPAADASATFSTISSGIIVTGSYFSLEEFLHRLEILPRAAKVTSISLATQGTDSTTGVATSEIQMQLQVEFFTTDTSAGPGSLPGPTEGFAPVVLPSPSPSPAESPSPETSTAPVSPSPSPGG